MCNGLLPVSSITQFLFPRGSHPVKPTLTRVFFTQLSVVGCAMGTRDQLGRLARLCEQADVRPVIDRVLPLANARDGFAAMIAGDLFGKIVFVVLAPMNPP
jgi:NADPH:quinone reductase-like Zn-dependent oxidoreductase